MIEKVEKEKLYFS